MSVDLNTLSLAVGSELFSTSVSYEQHNVAVSSDFDVDCEVTFT